MVAVSMCTALLIGSTKDGRLVKPVACTVSRPLPTMSHVAFTAPQLVWPNTKINFAPATLQANSMLPSTLRDNTLPAKRTLKMSPRPRSNRISAGDRESMQLSTTAMGCCPSLVASTCRIKSRCRRRPDTKRSLPSFNTCSTRAGVSLSCTSRVVTSTYCTWSSS